MSFARHRSRFYLCFYHPYIYIFTDHLPETEHVQSQKRVKRKRELIKKRIFSRKRRCEFNSKMEIQGFADQVQHVALDIGGKKPN